MNILFRLITFTYTIIYYRQDLIIGHILIFMKAYGSGNIIRKVLPL